MARPSPVPAQKPSRRGELLLLGVALLVALAVRVGLALGNSGLTMDSPLYVHMAEDVLAGHLGPSPAHHGYPLLVALASRMMPGTSCRGAWSRASPRSRWSRRCGRWPGAARRPGTRSSRR